MLRLCGVAGIAMGLVSAFSGVGHAQEIALPGVVVEAASPLETSDDGTFFPVTIVSQDELESGAPRSLGDVLFTKPGITSSTFASGASRPIIRGLDNFRVRIQENGIGVHDVSALSEDHGVPIDPLAQQKIEVVRGPATLRWGSQAIGGVVNATNNRIPDAIPNGKFYRFESKGAYSSVDEGGEGALIIEGGSGNFAFHGDLYKRRGSDYDTPKGTQENTSFDSEGGALGASLVFEDGYIGVSYSRFSSLYFIPGEEAVERDLRIDLEQTKITSKGEYRPRNSFVSAMKYWFGYTDYEHDEIGRGHGHEEEEEEHEEGEEEEGGELSIGSTFINKQYEARAEILHKPFPTAFGNMKGAVGVQYGFRDLGAAGEGGELLAPNETNSIAAYIFEEFQATEKLKIQLAGRVETVDIEGATSDFPTDFLPDGGGEQEITAREAEFTPYSASAGLLYQLSNGVIVRLTGQYVERAPDALELFAKGPHEATETFEIGNPNLFKEKAHTLELGLKRSKGRFRFDGSTYYTQFEGFIFKNFTGNSCGEEFESCIAGNSEELTQINYAQRDATFYGVELSGSVDLMEFANGTIGLDGQYDFVRAKFDEGGNVPRITPQRAGGGIFYRGKHLFARLGMLHAFRQDDVAVNEEATSGYILLNAELNYKIKLGQIDGSTPEMTIGIKGENLLDDDVRNHVSFKKEDVLQPGRNIVLRGKITLN